MSESGFIYAIGAVGTTYVKIGQTRRDVQTRLRALQTGHPLPLQTLATIPVETNLQRIETQVHRFLAEYRHHGEWFDTPMDTERLAALVARAIAWIDEQERRAIHAVQTPRAPRGTSSPFAARVKELREKRDWSQQELAKYARVPYMTIWRIERDAHKYTRMDIAVKLARAFGVSLDLLCGLYEESTESELEEVA